MHISMLVAALLPFLPKFGSLREVAVFFLFVSGCLV
jgi:hypothetical protein